MGNKHIERDNIEIKGHGHVENLITGASYHGVKLDENGQLTTREVLQRQYHLLNDKVSDLRKAYVAETDLATRIKLKNQIEEAEVESTQIEQRLEVLYRQQNIMQSMIDLIQSLPNLHDGDSQRAFLLSARIDVEAHDQIPVGKAPAQFAPLLVSTLAKYGMLQDGRHALEAALEAAKVFVGEEKRVRCDELILEVQTYFTGNTG